MWRRVLNERESSPEALEPGEVGGRLSAAASLEQLEGTAAALKAVSPAQLMGLPRAAFWINVYNALFRHAVRVLRPTGSVLTNLLLFERASYQVGPAVVSLSEIEHGLLRRNRRAAPFFRRPFSRSDVRFGWQVEQLDPRVHFALNCGAVSCPPIRAYDGAQLDRQLELATRGYLAQHTRIDRARCEVTLSRLISLYASDFGSRVEAVRFTARHLDGEDAQWLGENAERCTVRFGPYDWRLVPTG